MSSISGFSPGSPCLMYLGFHRVLCVVRIWVFTGFSVSSISWFSPSSQVELPCTPPEGHPAPEVSWRRDGVTLNLTDKVSHQSPTCIKHSSLRSTRGCDSKIPVL